MAAQEKAPYKIFNAKGKKVSYSRLLKTSSKSDIVFFGELHNNAIAHWLQYELTVDLLDKRQLILGAEMLEADNQNAVDNYLDGELTLKELKENARLWPNFKTDYKPLLDIAKDNQLQFIASNVPRRYASMVYKKGSASLDTLSSQEKEWMTPLPFAYDGELACYKKMLKMGAGHAGDNFPKAQALKDATMAHFILKHYDSNKLFLHYNGAYHSDYHEGIVWYINQKKANLKIITISTVRQAQLKRLDDEHLNKADFIICVDENMTNTY